MLIKEPTWPVKLGELHRCLASVGVSDDDTATNAQVSVPPSLVQSTGILRDTQLNVSIVSWLRACRLEAGGKSVDVASNHRSTIPGLVGLADSEGDDGAAIAGNIVLSTRLQLANPAIAMGKLLVTSLCELLLEVADGMEDCGVLGHELAVWFGEGLGLKLFGVDLVETIIGDRRGARGHHRLFHGHGTDGEVGIAGPDESRSVTSHGDGDSAIEEGEDE